MIEYKTVIKKFAKQGEKTGWTYIDIPVEIAEKIKPNTKTSYRVKGFINETSIKAMAIIPMGNGNFIMALNATIRKQLSIIKGQEVILKLTEDKKGYELNADFMECLAYEPNALSFFKTLTQGHQNYFSKWIDSAKTIETKTKRIALAVNALNKKWDYALMIRTQTAENKLFKK